MLPVRPLASITSVCRYKQEESSESELASNMPSDRTIRKPAIPSSGTVFRAEEDRIRDAYARRPDPVNDDRYSIFRPGNIARLQEIERHALHVLTRNGQAQLRSRLILEVGCGYGFWLRKFVEWGADPTRLYGVDLLEARIEEAARLTAPGTNLRIGSASDLDFADATFDVVCQFMMFSSILDQDLHSRIASEMMRVLKPDGVILWYDFHANNPCNRDVRGLRQSEVRRIFSGCKVSLTRITFLPPLTRRLGWISARFYNFASEFKILNSHYIGAITKRPNS
jgi:SAM-dependent methyltransferase